LVKAFKLLDADIKIPTRKQLSNKILNRVYDRYLNFTNEILDGQTFCIGSDGWSNRKNLPVVNYMVLSNSLEVFLESVSKDISHSTEWIASDLTRVYEKFHGNGKFVLGFVTDNTNGNQAAWKILTRKYPHTFAYGCASHALHLLVKDIISPPKLKENNPSYVTGTGSRALNQNIEPMYPPNFCFEDLIETVKQCKVIVKYFKHHYRERIDLFDKQRQNHDIALAEQGDTRWGTLLGKLFQTIL